MTEQNGGSIVTTKSFSGETIHTLHVDAVGVEGAFREWDFYAG